MEETASKENQTESSVIIGFWKQFDLDAKRSAWDKTCTELREQKTSSITGRKRLNELTKSFRARSKEEQMVSMAELLKAYQEEIDQLSRRSKFSESAYFAIYKTLYDAPDPVPCMEHLMNNAINGSSHALEIERLRAELSHYDEEFQRLKNQDITIRRLEDQLAEFKDSTEATVLAEVERRLAVITAEADERVQEAQEQQKSVEKRCLTALEAAKQAQYMADRAQAQLFEADNKHQVRISQLVAENSLLAETTQRLQVALVEMEARASAPAPVPARQPSSTPYEAIITQLTEEARVLQAAQHMDRMAFEKQLKDLAAALAVEQASVMALQKECAQKVSKEEHAKVLREMRTLQKVVSPASSEPESANEDTLEDLLANRIKLLDRDATALRKELAEAQVLASTQQSTAEALKAALQTATALNQQLEAELEQRANTMDEIMAGKTDLASVLDTTTAAPNSHPQMVTWLQLQRDKYKLQLNSSESTVMKLQAACDNLESKYANLERDNVALYSRIKYLQQAKPQQQPQRMERAYNQMEEGRYAEDEVEGKYGMMYEQRMNPFAEFSLIEKQRKLRELSVADRIVLNTTMAIISNHTGRSALLLYLGAMHLLVFFTIYHSAHNVHHGCDPAMDHVQAHAHHAAP